VFVLDTNVLSEVLKLRPSPRVLEWLSGQRDTERYTTAVSLAEMASGVKLLAEGKRRTDLQEQVEWLFSRMFAGRVLAFDEKAAVEYAEVWELRRKAGRPVSQSDAQIAAICRAQGARLVSRNVKDFKGCGFVVVNPWGEEL
jgi:toxin FitB